MLCFMQYFFHKSTLCTIMCTVLQSKRGKRANVVDVLSYSSKGIKSVYFEFVGRCSKYLHSFVGGHMLSRNIDVPVWLHFVN